MPNTHANRGDEGVADVLARLVASDAIPQFQADQIASIWPQLDADAFAHPYLLSVPEHTRAYLEKVSQSCPH